MTDETAGAPAPVKPEGIAILGSHPATVQMAPFNAPWLIYACSPHNYERRQLPRFDEWFEVHDHLADRTRAYPYLRWLETIEQPVWMRDTDAIHLFPTARLYPEQELRGEAVTRIVPFMMPDGKRHMRPRTTVTRLGTFSYYHFTSSIAYMTAKAIADIEAGKAAPRLGFFGILQASDGEYAEQRPGFQYFLDQAMRRGIEVFAPDITDLFEPQATVW